MLINTNRLNLAPKMTSVDVPDWSPLIDTQILLLATQLRKFVVCNLVQHISMLSKYILQANNQVVCFFFSLDINNISKKYLEHLQMQLDMENLCRYGRIHIAIKGNK